METTLRPELVDVILRDGATLRLRPPTTGDADALVAFYAALSASSLYARFHGARHVDRSLVEHLFDTDDRGALIATVAEADDEHVVAVAEYARLRDVETAEVAFAVADDLQGHGLGTRLLEQLALLAARAGIKRFVAEVLPENGHMLRVFANAGFDLSRKRTAGEIEVSFEIAATDDFRARVDERDHVAVTASLSPFFQPKSVAVIGASRRRGSIGGELFRNILAADFSGATYPVNRGAEPVAGVRGYASVADIDATVDLAVICLPAAQVEDATQTALAAGVKALCVISSGFAEVGHEGAIRQERLLALVRAHRARLIGPNCLGIAIPPIGLNATFAPRALPPGRIAFSSQSGALGLALLEKAAERNLGFSSFVSIGNKADVSSNDLLEYWETDDKTELVLLYLESFGNPRKFGRLAARIARKKPILALKAGTTGAGARAASSHTAALAGSETAVDALFRQAGVLRARTLEELIDAASLLSSQPLPKGRRTVIITNAGDAPRPWDRARPAPHRSDDAGAPRAGTRQSASRPARRVNSLAPAGRMMVQMLGVFAEFEQATIVERVIAGMERKAARGEWNGGSVPFGYRLDPERRYLEPEPAEASIVEEIFERYVERLHGSQAIGRWLSQRGYRTKQGKPFNPQAVLTILRNRAYLGQISFRGTHHPAPHTPLIEQALFERAQAILGERGEDHSLRRSNQSDYLLTGLVKCVRCGKRYLGAAANGNGGRYRYYVCFSRQRYGRATCDGDSLPADELEHAILNQLQDLLAREDDVREAITAAFADLNNQQPKRDAELTRLDADVRKVNEALDRYFGAFENGTMPEQACAPRIADLTKRLSELQARRDELAADGDDAPEALNDDDLHALQAHVAQVIADGEPAARKALLQALVDEIRVASRDEIYPFFTLPTVRPPYGSVPPAGIEPAHAV